MHKIVLGVDQGSLEELNDTLSKNGIAFKLWTEQPEKITTCIATKPYSKTLIEKYFKAFKLFR